jgi:hypothetical protein
VALSQVKTVSWGPHVQRNPQYSRPYAQARCSCAQVIHMLVHSQQVSSPLAALAGRCGSAHQRLPDTTSTPDPRPGARARIRSRKNPGRRRPPPPGRRARAYCFRLPRGDLARALGRDLGHRGRHSGRWPTCRSWRKTFPPGRIRKGPSMYEMEGPSRPRRARSVSCLALLALRAAAGARYPREGPVSRLLPRPRGRPQMVPVSSGESISTASADAAQEPEAHSFRIFPLSTRYPQKECSYPHPAVVIHWPIHSPSTSHPV